MYSQCRRNSRACKSLLTPVHVKLSIVSVEREIRLEKQYKWPVNITAECWIACRGKVWRSCIAADAISRPRCAGVPEASTYRCTGIADDMVTEIEMLTGWRVLWTVSMNGMQAHQLAAPGSGVFHNCCQHNSPTLERQLGARSRECRLRSMQKTTSSLN